jgi:hypothetical protein
MEYCVPHFMVHNTCSTRPELNIPDFTARVTPPPPPRDSIGDKFVPGLQPLLKPHLILLFFIPL